MLGPTLKSLHLSQQNTFNLFAGHKDPHLPFPCHCGKLASGAVAGPPCHCTTISEDSWLALGTPPKDIPFDYFRLSSYHCESVRSCLF